MRPAFVLSLLLSVASAVGAAAAPGDLTLASTSDDEVKGDMDSFNASLSADGTSVAFDSFATNLELADPDNNGDVYVKDLVTGELVLASTNGGGVKGDNSSSNASLAPGGSHVAFDSVATNLDPADMDVVDADVYVKDLATGGLTLASATSDGVKGDGASIMPSLSADGAWVAFSSSSTNLDVADTDVAVDIYVKDLVTGAIKVVSTSDAGTKGNGDSSDASLSPDGTSVAFSSSSTNLDPADTSGDLDLYVKNLTSGEITLASISNEGVKGNGSSSAPSLSADGSAVAFSSFATNLDGADGDVDEDVYVKDLGGDLVLASTSDDGTKGDAPSGAPSLSADGVTVAFHSSASNLDPGHTDGSSDVYVKELATDDIALVSSPESARPSLSASGASVAFESTSTNLDPADTDDFADIYVRELGADPPIGADLEVTVTGTPDPVASGHFLTYILLVTNHGGSVATGVTLVDVIDDAKLWSVTTGHGSCTEDPRLGTVDCALGSLSDQEIATVEIVVRAVRPKTSPIVNTATVSGNEPDPVPGNDTDTLSTTIGGLLT